MKAIVDTLKELCSKFLLKEKLLIVDSYSIGEQISEAYVKQGNQAINLKTVTVKDLALEIVECNSSVLYQLIDPALGSHFTYQFLKNLKKENKLTYFQNLEITAALSHQIFNRIQLLRNHGFNGDILNKEDFLTEEKGTDYIEILNAYENILTQNGFIDYASLLKLANEFALKNERSVFILQSNLQLSFLEEELLSKMISTEVYKLPLVPVSGIILPEKSALQSISWGNPTPLSYLYEIEDAPPNINLSTFTAKTEEVEVKHIFEKIKLRQWKLDELSVFYTSPEPYITLFYHLSQKMNIPITFGEGLPITFSSPGKLVVGILSWMNTQYSVTRFIDILNEGLIDFGSHAPTKTAILRILNDTQIGWGQDRYLRQIEKEINNIQDILSKTGGEKYKQSYEKKLFELNWLKQWFTIIFKQLPTINSEVNFSQLLNGISKMLTHCKTSSALDLSAKSTLLEQIDKVLPFSSQTISSYDAFEKINDLLLALKINQSKPQPGHIHITSYQQGVYHSREIVFIVGLDNRKFPGGTSEDPLLLDFERKALKNSIPLWQEQGKEKLYTMLQLLANSTSEVIVSYSNFNINENRAISPSYLFLQCFRMETANSKADFKELKEIPATLVPDVIEGKDYWNSKMFKGSSYTINRDIYDHFNHLENGISAETMRLSKHFTSFDGKVNIDTMYFDNRENEERMLSAGKLETLAKCPYSYFLEDILRVRPFERTSYPSNNWLNPATRGSLLHSIFETFYKQLQVKREKPSVEKHKDLILTIATECITIQKEEIPPPNERIFHLEIKDIYDCCTIFLQEEEEHCKQYQPIQFEYTFGMEGQEPAIITLPNGKSIRVSGKIDRVDQTSDHKYHIIDYKTGSTYGYGMNQYYKGGRQLQHFIYSLAIEQHLQLEMGSVQESSYYFPTIKGLGKRFLRIQNETTRSNGLDILERLINVITSGHFTLTDDPNDCKFCDYQKVCRRSFYPLDLLELKHNHEELKTFRGVRAYD